jgi:hypothetical protein
MPISKRKRGQQAAAPEPDAATVLSLPETVLLPIDKVRPYWRNPRRVTEETVNMLVKSIEEFGYQQPIVVDTENVIIVGHTRYAAMRRLGVTEVPVVVARTLSVEEVKQYRLIDNRAGELSSWDMGALMDELGDLDMGKMLRFFPEFATVTDEEAYHASDQATLEREWDKVQTSVEFVCVSCFHTFEVEVTKAAIMAGFIPASDKPEGQTSDDAAHA